jgi:hypothetical protein
MSTGLTAPDLSRAHSVGSRAVIPIRMLGLPQSSEDTSRAIRLKSGASLRLYVANAWRAEIFALPAPVNSTPSPRPNPA